ncbi:MAG TPA: cache domain-containing protein, partial [Telluria sp.]|nr:cache domain-containing protein [Telluria sp.]
MGTAAASGALVCDAGQDIPDLKTTPVPTRLRMKPRSTLFRKHLINFVVLAGFLLLASGTISLYFSWQDSREAFLELQRMRAEAAADGIAQRLSGIVSQIGASAPSPATANDVASRAHDIGLLRQLPAISDVLLLDREGREQLRMPRAGSETAGSKTDYSRSAAFQQARVGQPYFSPVYLGADNEPRITIAMATAPEGTSIIVAEIDIRFLLDGLGRIASDGPVYVADAHGQVIALADPELKLQKTGLALPAMDADAQAMVAPLGWKVAITIPSGAALVPLPALAARSAALMLIGLLAMAAAGMAMIRRAARQVSALQEEQEQAVRRAAAHAQAAQEERQAVEQAHKRLLD